MHMHHSLPVLFQRQSIYVCILMWLPLRVCIQFDCCKRTPWRLQKTTTKLHWPKYQLSYPLLIFILFLQAFNNMLSLPIMSTSVACDVVNSFLYADYVRYVQQLTCFVSWYVHSGGRNILANDKCGDKCTEERQCQSENAGICTVACTQTYVVNISVKQKQSCIVAVLGRSQKSAPHWAPKMQCQMLVFYKNSSCDPDNAPICFFIHC